MKHLGHVTIFDRPVYSARVADFTTLNDLELPTTQSVLLLVSDASGVDPDTIYSAASKLIERGVIYACTWGTDCERVHDIFDEADVRDGSEFSEDFVITTWHDDDSLDEAVEFFLTGAFPLDQHLDDCSWVAIEVGGSTSESPVEDSLSRAINATETQNKRMGSNG